MYEYLLAAITCVRRLVIQGILGKTPDSSQHEFLRFRHNAQKLHPARFTVGWSSRHVGTEVNEETDKLANQGSEMIAEGKVSVPTVSHARRQSRVTRRKIFDSCWEASQPIKYQKWMLKSKRRPPELALPRDVLARYLAERSSHGDFVSYHQRFRRNHEGKPCRCGVQREQGYFVECPLVDRSLIKGLTRGKELEEILGATGWF